MTTPVVIFFIVALGTVALIVGSLLFQQKKGAPPKPATSTRTPPATPTSAPGTTSATKKPWPWWVKGSLWVFVGIPLFLFLLLLVYQQWDWVEKGFWHGKGVANNAIAKEIVIDTLKSNSWNDIPSGRYRMEVRGDMYFYKCPGDKGAASGYPEGKTLSGGKDGKIILWSGIARDNPQGNGGEFIVGPQDKVFWKFDTECPNQETVVQQSTVSVNLSPVRLK